MQFKVTSTQTIICILNLLLVSFVNRCLVPECETAETAQYDTAWIQHAIPGTFSNPDGNFIPDVCQRYKFSNDTASHESDTCPAQWFTNEQIKCDKWVYDENEHTIVQDVCLMLLEFQLTRFKSVFIFIVGLDMQ